MSESVSVESARSRSRGRDFVSTGRGGAGNFVRSESETRGRVSRDRDGDERGRELSPGQAGQRITHTGRGGAGNIRSPSRDPTALEKELAQEREAIAAAQGGPNAPTFSTGRGGVGNIHRTPSRERSSSANPTTSRSLSRDPAPGKRFTSSGRGGRGNIHTPTPHSQQELEKLEEDERAAISNSTAGVGEGEKELHSTGRGGAGNLTNAHEPEGRHSHSTAEVPFEDGGVHSHGKGGYGNITHSGQATPDGEKKHHNALGEIWDKVTHKNK